MSVKQAVRNYHDEFEAERKRVVDNSRAAWHLIKKRKKFTIIKE